MSIEIFGLNETVGNRRLKMPEDAFGGTYEANVLTSGSLQPSTSHIPVFSTDAAAQVAKPVTGTMTYSTQQTNGRIYIYDGSTWGFINLNG